MVPDDVCQYCGADLDAHPPGSEIGYLYGVECSRCPPERRQSHMLARERRVEDLVCPDCGAEIAPAEGHPDVLVVKEMTYDVCPACGSRCGVSGVRKLRDVAGGVM
jgi:DNA-directed RNA polymerase subunit RPC12/RpoP